MTSTLARKAAREGDIVELTEDQPKYNLTRGQRAVVITEFEKPSEAYDLAVEDDEGNFLGFAYSIKPDQIINRTREAFEQGMLHLDEMKLVDAERHLEKAIKLTPQYKGVILNSILASCSENLELALILLRLLVQIAPDYDLARNNLAITFLNIGVQKARDGKLEDALEYYSYAIGIDADEKIISQLRENFAAAYTDFGLREYRNGNYERTVKWMRTALIHFQNHTTRHNLGVSYAHYARSCMQQGKYGLAIDAFTIAEDVGLRSPELLNDFGVSYASEGYFDQAARLFERALQLDPENQSASENLAKLDRHESFSEFLLQDVTPDFVLLPAVLFQSRALLEAA